MRDENELRSEIFEKVTELYHLRKEKEKFIPGKTKINYAGRVYDQNDMYSLVDSALDFWLTSGRYAQKFEEEFAAFLGKKYCLLTNSGSSANLLAVSALTSPKLGDKKLKPGDEVITTACGFPTTLNPIIQNNLTPVFIDIELGTYNIIADFIPNAISNKTKAIFVPHTLGNPANIKSITDIAKDYNLWLIEDNCDALGSKYDGKYTGTYGDISTFSFYPAHHITMGEGGAVVTDNLLLKKIIASIRDWGRDCWCEPGCDNSCNNRFGWQSCQLPFGYDHKYIYSHIGYNLKVTDMQAAIGVEQLKKLPSFIHKRNDNFTKIYNSLKKYESILILPKQAERSKPSWFGFPIIVKENANFNRTDIVRYLEDNNIATRMLFGGNLLKQPAYQGINYRLFGTLENTDRVMENLFWIGVYPGLTDEMINYVIVTLEMYLDKFNI